MKTRKVRRKIIEKNDSNEENEKSNEFEGVEEVFVGNKRAFKRISYATRHSIKKEQNTSDSSDSSDEKMSEDSSSNEK